MAIYSEIVAKKLSTPVTTILIAALIPLAPGGGIYYTMYNLLDKNYPIAVQKGIQTFIIAGAMAVGIFSASTIFKLYNRFKKKQLGGINPLAVFNFISKFLSNSKFKNFLCWNNYSFLSFGFP